MDSEKFSVEIHHGGFFVGSGVNARYLDEKLAWFDNLDRRTFCNDFIDYMLREVGYPTGLHLVFWCPPGCSIDQVTEILFEHEVRKMSAASVESKVLVIFLSHVKGNKKTEPDDISVAGCPELPKVMIAKPPASPIAMKQDADESESSDGGDSFEHDSEGDPNWYDSDYDFAKDDELYVENVDESEEDEFV